MNVSLLIARRLSLRRDGGDNGVRRSPAVTIAVAGIALSITIMLLTLAIVPGFKHEITRKVMGFDAQVTMHPVQPTAGYDTQQAVALTPEFAAMIADSLPSTAIVELTIRQPGILKTDDQFAGLVFKAFDGDPAGQFIADCIEGGGIPDYGVDCAITLSSRAQLPMRSAWHEVTKSTATSSRQATCSRAVSPLRASTTPTSTSMTSCRHSCR